ncbi:hypothetical protein ACWE42_14625 [Sutcliffiella cohnii]
MNLHNLVLSQDISQATNLIECCLSCLNRVRMEFQRGNLDECERWLKEFDRCKRDLDGLMTKKQVKDKMERLAKDLTERGYNVEIISWKARKNS